MQITLVDNYDSFTYNLVHYFETLDCVVRVVRNDAISVAELQAQNPDGIVLSPGPCTPNESGICLEIVKQLGNRIPILGVCLGHQAIAQAFGATIIKAPHVVHGKTSAIQHDEQGLFYRLPKPLTATRYHSLVIDRQSLPDCLVINAWTDDHTIMGIQHRTYPITGVQFHPESILTAHGHDLLANWRRIAKSL